MNKRQKIAIVLIIAYLSFSPALYVIGKLFKITIPLDIYMIPIYLILIVYAIVLFLIAICEILEGLS